MKDATWLLPKRTYSSKCLTTYDVVDEDGKTINETTSGREVTVTFSDENEVQIVNFYNSYNTGFQR